MGQTLSEPAVEKHTTYDEDDTLVYACSEMQGWRLSMLSLLRLASTRRMPACLHARPVSSSFRPLVFSPPRPLASCPRAPTEHATWMG